MARIADEEIERLKSRGAPGGPRDGLGGRAEKGRSRPGGPLPVPRRPRAQLGREPGQEPLALPGGLRGGRVDDRLGDALEGSELPPRSRAAACRPGRQRRSMALPRCALPCGTCPFGSSPTPATPRRSPRWSSSTTRPCSARPTPSLTSVLGASITPKPSRFSSLGHANRTLAYRLPNRQTKPGAEARGRLQRLGVLRESGHEHLNGCVVVPVFEPSGAVVELYGRKLDWDPRTGQPAHLYLPGPHRGVWNEEGLRRQKWSSANRS